MDQFKKEWVEMLQAMVDSFRRSHPNDTRDDRQICDSIMQHFVSCGVVKIKDGKYVLPKVRDPKKFVALVKGPMDN